MIKDKKKKKLPRFGSLRFSRKKSDNNSSSRVKKVLTTKISQSDGEITSPSTSSAEVCNSITTPISTKPRSYSPSDYYFHTTAQGGVNASLTPLSEHYETNETLLSLFSSLYERDQYSVAYAAGVKFVEVALFQIPKNGYFKNKKYQKQRTKSAADALRVTKLLGGMLDEMEEDEETSSDGKTINGMEKVEKLQKLANLAQRSFDEAIDDETKDDDEKEVETSSTENQDWDVAKQVSQFFNELGSSAGAGIDNVMDMPDNCCTIFSGDVENVVQSGAESLQRKNSSKELEILQQRQHSKSVKIERLSLDNDFKQEESQQHCQEHTVRQPQTENNDRFLEEGNVSVESVEEIQSASKSQLSNDVESRDEDKLDVRDQVEETRSDELDEELKVALSMSLAESVDPTISTSIHDDTKRDQDGKKPTVAAVANLYREKYNWLRENGSFQVRFLDTYQGRMAESTNGCTVVAPLMCINYFTSERTENGIPDEMINEVIDVQTVSVLPQVRSKLGLPRDSFIIPSDVHDYLIDTGLLSTSQFVGVCGGSILDDDHIEQFKTTLLLLNDERERKRLKGKRLGATFFFAGHVIAFHVINNDGCYHIELIDSLPNHETWKIRQSDVSSCEDREPSDSSSRYSGNAYDEWERSDRFDYEVNRNAVRVRCLDIRHVDTLIRHYALDKFSDEEKRFCDEHVWQEANSSFDPRVFQAFIWAEA